MISRRLPGIINTTSRGAAFSSLAHRRAPQRSLPASYYRGGTSRAVFFKQGDLPTDRTNWDEIFRRVIGSPDPNGRQLDGLGGGISSLSKICVVGPSTRPDADIDYTFVAMGVKDSQVDYSSNCGNMISAVGPFAVDSQLVPVEPDGHAEADLRIHNTNTGKIIRSRFPVEDGEAASSGSFAIDGVAGTAAKIQLDFLDPAGSRTGALLPTGQVVDTFDGVSTTCIDVGNPCCFVLASDLGVQGTITPDEIDAHPTLLSRLDSIRRQAGVAMGLADHPDGVSGSVPKIGMVSAPSSNTQASGPAVDVVVRALSVGQPHRAVPITVALALAAAAKVPGSVVASMTRAPPVDETGITLGHASGTLMVGAEFGPDGQLSHATVFRTARRLMEGRVFWKA
ncbi:hypothetical protein HFD88_002207 [Aspergillus terreus]|nr:hypothetical protein HFD88_002207 [Aspergillus terreus]